MAKIYKIHQTDIKKLVIHALKEEARRLKVQRNVGLAKGFR